MRNSEAAIDSVRWAFPQEKKWSGKSKLLERQFLYSLRPVAARRPRVGYFKLQGNASVLFLWGRIEKSGWIFPLEHAKIACDGRTSGSWSNYSIDIPSSGGLYGVGELELVLPLMFKKFRFRKMTVEDLYGTFRTHYSYFAGWPRVVEVSAKMLR